MDQELKDRWLAALKSGKYKKGMSALCSTRSDGNYYCCLGVLADLLVQDNKGTWVKRDDFCLSFVDKSGDKCAGLIPNKDILSENTQWHLVRINDSSVGWVEVIREIEIKC